MQDSKYEQAGWIQHAQIFEIAGTSDPRFGKLLSTLSENISRIEGVWLLLPYLVDTTERSTALSLMAVHRVLQSFDLNDPRLSDAKVAKEVEETFALLGIEWHRDHHQEDEIGRSIYKFKRVLMNSPQKLVNTGIETILASQILNAWTAVEICLKDLWELALNIGPEDWILRVMKCPPYSKFKEQEKSVTASQLHKFRFDLRAHMGTILKEKINFETVEEVLAAYSSVFGEDEIKTCCAAYLEGAFALEATRHLLTHKAGIIDQAFSTKTKNLPLLQALPVNTKLLIDGEIAGKLAKDGIALVVALVRFVDAKIKESSKLSTQENDDLSLRKAEGL